MISHSHSLRICIAAGNPIINSIIGQYAHRFLGGGSRRTARAPRTLPRFARGGGHQADSHAHRMHNDQRQAPPLRVGGCAWWVGPLPRALASEAGSGDGLA